MQTGRQQTRARRTAQVPRAASPSPTTAPEILSRSATAPPPRPLAVLSSLASTTPVSGHRVAKNRGLAERILTGVCVEHQPGLIGAPGNSRAGRRAQFS